MYAFHHNQKEDVFEISFHQVNLLKNIKLYKKGCPLFIYEICFLFTGVLLENDLICKKNLDLFCDVRNVLNKLHKMT